jgi:uncharacterized protein
VFFGEHRLHGWWLQGTQADTLIYHHGNGGNVGANAEQACRLQKMGFSVLIFDYRGYGRSEGEFPTERSVYADAENAWDYVTREKQVVPANVILYGHSLGGAVAIEMASRHPDAGGLVVESAFTSIYDMGTRDGTFTVFPLRLLLTQHMDSITKIPRLRMPILFIHGTADEIVPAEMSRTLFAAAHDPKTLLMVPGAGHENVASVGGDVYRAAWLRFAQSIGTKSSAVASH